MVVLVGSAGVIRYLGPVATIMQRNILHGNWGPVRAIIQGIPRGCGKRLSEEMGRSKKAGEKVHFQKGFRVHTSGVGA